MANGWAVQASSFVAASANWFGSWAPVIGAVFIIIFCLASWVLAPKGETQTYVAMPIATPLSYLLWEKTNGIHRVWRSSLVLSAVACYLMWRKCSMSPWSGTSFANYPLPVVTFMVQLHPLIGPRRGDLRPEYATHHPWVRRHTEQDTTCVNEDEFRLYSIANTAFKGTAALLVVITRQRWVSYNYFNSW